MKNNLFISGTAGGTLCSILPVLSSEDILKTIILAAIGAVVSCMVSFLIKTYWKKDE
ncbi:hypothetical protein [Mesonia aquimarina]|uniref:hypothetical protein n=1 Tax=Mesonia aquimarina TaxID=1504967 RepID=UPI0013CF09B7|nr:hypothetical protein [Mesonia aquimarina]